MVMIFLEVLSTILIFSYRQGQEPYTRRIGLFLLVIIYCDIWGFPTIIEECHRC
jgi:hypothetical protein